MRALARILLVEDSPTDAELTAEVVREAHGTATLEHVETGDEALAAVRREPRPDLVLLDLELPGQHGHEVLGEIKRDAALRDIPIVVLTASEAREDLANSWEQEADGYIVKPVTGADLHLALAIIEKRGVRAGRRP